MMFQSLQGYAQLGHIALEIEVVNRVFAPNVCYRVEAEHWRVEGISCVTILFSTSVLCGEDLKNPPSSYPAAHVPTAQYPPTITEAPPPVANYHQGYQQYNYDAYYQQPAAYPA
ncbi:unnamed protein product, partial [Timema podura]|nr:unnamed protein product [Timema podura]